MTEKVFLFGLINSAVLFCLYKWRVVDQYEKRIKWPEWCEFCFCFWISNAEFIVYYLKAGLCVCNTETLLKIFLYSLASAAATRLFFKP
jgi:hypothetical protein